MYYRLGIFIQTGTEGHDLMALTKQQVIADVLDRYEVHLPFLQYSHDNWYASILTAGNLKPAPTDQTDNETQ